MKLVDLGVRRAMLFAGDTSFSINYPSGIGRMQSDMLVAMFGELDAHMAAHCVPAP